MEPVDLSVKTPVVLQVPKYPPQRLRNPPPSGKIQQPPGECSFSIFSSSKIQSRRLYLPDKKRGSLLGFEALLNGLINSVPETSTYRTFEILRLLFTF